jgi:hypothetical protein
MESRHLGLDNALKALRPRFGRCCGVGRSEKLDIRGKQAIKLAPANRTEIRVAPALSDKRSLVHPAGCTRRSLVFSATVGLLVITG